MNQQTCNPAWLDAFLKNELNESEEQMLTSHLDECSDCREELESRAAEQSVWREASNLLGGCIVLSTAAISDIRSGTVSSPRIDLVLQQLAPTDDPESLGRIGGYEVTGVVGAGGMGVVLKAHDRSLDRIVAIKVMSPHLASSGSARRRFAREAKAAAAVLHPNVIAIHSVASEDASPYLVMPYVRGASLQKRIDSQGPLPLKDTLRIGAQIAAGLAAAHEQGLVHRDIKPANILLEEGVERVTITDFGLARAVDDASMTCSGVIAGTPQYMSPEQTRGEPIDARSDLFSLGSVLYAMCAGRSPFRAETTYGVLHRIANDNPTPVCEVNTDVPVWLGHIIERLMAKRPEDRFESATQVAELLEGCLAHVQQPAAIALPDAVAALAPKKTRRPPIGKFIAAAVGAFALFFAGILIVLEVGKGTLTIESELDDVPIRIMQGEDVVKSLTVSKEGATTRIGAGKYIVEIGQEFDKAVIKDGGVELSRGATAIVKVTQTNTNTAADEKAKDEAAKAWLRRPVVGSTHDGKSFQLAGHDALMHSVMTNNSEALNRLLTMDKYDLDFSPSNGSWTLLQTALQHSCLETTSLLLRHGANPNFASKGTPLPLELAKRSGRKELVALVQRNIESVPPVNTISSDTLTHTDVEKITETAKTEQETRAVLRTMQYLKAIQENDTEMIKSIAKGLAKHEQREKDIAALLKESGIPKQYKTWFVNHTAVIALGPVSSSNEEMNGRFLLFTLSLVDERWSIVDIDLEEQEKLLERFKNRTQGVDATSDTAPFAKLLTTWEEVEARVESIVKEREAILNADVDFKLDYAGNHTSKRRYHVWLNDLNRRSDCRGVSSDGTEDYSTIVTPTFGWFDDHQDKTKSQFHRRDPKDPVGWGTLGCIVDIRKVGLINWSIESIDTHEFDEDLLPKDRIETHVETGEHEGIQITIVKLKRKPDGVAESWTEYWLSPAHGNYPIYTASGWKESENSAEEYIVSQRTQWKFIDGVWFPTSVKHRYLCEQRKMDELGTYELVKARLNVNPFPNVFDPLEDTGESDTSRKSQVEDPIASEPALGLAEKVKVAKGETGSGSYKIKLLVLASDDLKPVAGAMVDVTLIRTDSGFSGDGGFSDFKTDADGVATIDNSLWPGRYQILVRAPEGSRFRDTEFSKDESILVVHEDGRYSPREFRLAVDENKSPK